MLSTSELKSAHSHYRYFVFFNVISFTLVAGNIMQLYALRLGAGIGLMGIMSSMGSLTFMFSLIGRKFIPRLGVVGVKGYFWMIRYLFMIPIILLVIPSLREQKVLVFALIIFGVFGFNLFKGMSLAAEKPIIGWISKESERASFLAGNQIINFGLSMIIGLIMAFFLGKESPLYLYTIYIAVGISAGIICSLFTLKLPEPEDFQYKINESLLRVLKQELRNHSFKRLLTAVFLSNTAMSMTASFIILYFKKVYGSSDGSIVFYTVAGSIGALSMALISRFITDRVGSKPMYFAFHLLRLLMLLSLIISPGITNKYAVVIFISFIFFTLRMSGSGMHSTADIYFFSTTEGKDRMNIGIIFNLIRGLAGVIGALGGGFILSKLQIILPATDPDLPFQVYFALSGILFIINLFLILGLPDVSDYSINDVLSIIFSPRDLKAIGLLNRLAKTNNRDEEKNITTALSHNKSSLIEQELQKALDSSDHLLRSKAASSLRQMGEKLNKVESSSR